MSEAHSEQLTSTKAGTSQPIVRIIGKTADAKSFLATVPAPARPRAVVQMRTKELEQKIKSVKVNNKNNNAKTETVFATQLAPAF